MKGKTALVLTLGALATALVVDETINNAYESTIKFLGRHPKLRNNPIGKGIENVLIDRYISRNMPRERADYIPQSPPVTTMVVDERDSFSTYERGLDRTGQALPKLDDLRYEI